MAWDSTPTPENPWMLNSERSDIIRECVGCGAENVGYRYVETGDAGATGFACDTCVDTLLANLQADRDQAAPGPVLKPAYERLCTVLGLDPKSTTSVTLSLEGGQIWVRWEGGRPVVGTAKKSAVLADLADALEGRVLDL